MVDLRIYMDIIIILLLWIKYYNFYNMLCTTKYPPRYTLKQSFLLQHDWQMMNYHTKKFIRNEDSSFVLMIKYCDLNTRNFL
jgi:hypothetical protein